MSFWPLNPTNQPPSQQKTQTRDQTPRNTKTTTVVPGAADKRKEPCAQRASLAARPRKAASAGKSVLEITPMASSLREASCQERGDRQVETEFVKTTRTAAFLPCWRLSVSSLECETGHEYVPFDSGWSLHSSADHLRLVCYPPDSLSSLSKCFSIDGSFVETVSYHVSRVKPCQ